MVLTHRTLLILGITAVLGSIGAAEPAAAQTMYPRGPGANSSQYQPRLSPYLDLLRRDNSVLSPYHSFVVPRRGIYQQQMQQSAQIGRLQQDANQRARSNAGNGSRLPTGRGGQFQNYMHFFPRNNQR
jgi:hypothetical protein